MFSPLYTYTNNNYYKQCCVVMNNFHAGWTLTTDDFVDVTFQLGEEGTISSSVRNV